MARIKCAISGVLFTASYLDSLKIPATAGFPHPIFCAAPSYLERLYVEHTKGNLSPADSYLLFIAYLHSTNSIEWAHPANCNPAEQRTKTLIENNIAQLLNVIEQTKAIRHPHFIQPKFRVAEGNAELLQIKNWIRAWQSNINDFYSYTASREEQDALVKVENRLSSLILKGEEPKRYAGILAQWADKTAAFPEDKAEDWKKAICNCFHEAKLVSTPFATLKEVKDYCALNIEVGSIHFHTLYQYLEKGMAAHTNYLGATPEALGYHLLNTEPEAQEKALKNSFSLSDPKAVIESDKELVKIAAEAADKPPVAEDYATNLDFIKAKLAYRVRRNAEADAKAVEGL